MSEREQTILDAMAFVENASERLGTTSYIWGGFTLDIYEGKFLRNHSDIDYLTVALLQLRAQFIEVFEKAGWKVGIVINGDLSAVKNGVKLHLGNVQLGNRAVWTHNGEKAALAFPLNWLRKEATEFCDIKVRVVEAEFEYVVKHFPALLNPNWIPRDKDRAAQQKLSEIRLEKKVHTGDLHFQVSDKRGTT